MKLRNKKTGDIWEFDGGFSMKGSDETAEKAGGRGCSVACYANSIADLIENWEDAEPAEPLIKDEKIRKAVRAWAEACGAKQIKYSIAPNQYYDADMGTGFSIKFLTKPVEVCLEEGKNYTIAELCGEEEE